MISSSVEQTLQRKAIGRRALFFFLRVVCLVSEKGNKKKSRSSYFCFKVIAFYRRENEATVQSIDWLSYSTVDTNQARTCLNTSHNASRRRCNHKKTTTHQPI